MKKSTSKAHIKLGALGGEFEKKLLQTSQREKLPGLQSPSSGGSVRRK